MTKKILLAGIGGGIVLFVWSFISHVLLPLGEVGIRSIPNEEPVLEAMRANIPTPGFYFFPGIAPRQHRDEAAMKEWEERAKRGPMGILIYQTHGEGAMSPKQLATEFASNVALAILAALVLSQIAGSLMLRAGVGAVLGLIAGLDVYVSYWNWYKFPTNYTVAVMSDQLIGFLLMGAVIAAILRKQ